MMVTTRGSILRLIRWQWKYVTFFSVCATATTVAHHYFEMRWLKLPTLPLAVVGAALGIAALARAVRKGRTSAASTNVEASR